jgi:hypothetical protein
MRDIAFPEILKQIEAVHPGMIQPSLRSYSQKHSLNFDTFAGIRLLDRGYCYSGVLGQLDQSDGICAEHQFLTIPAAGGVVPEKRHFRLLPNPRNPADPWVNIDEEFVIVLCGVLIIVGADVEEPVQIKPGEERLSYGCYCDRAQRTVRWFQDRHALQADRPWTTMIFRHCYTTLSILTEIFGPQHPDLLELQSRGIWSPSGQEIRT